VFGRSRVVDIRWLTIRCLNAVHAPANPGFASMWYPSNGNVYLQEIGNAWFAVGQARKYIIGPKAARKRRSR